MAQAVDERLSCQAWPSVPGSCQESSDAGTRLSLRCRCGLSLEGRSAPAAQASQVWKGVEGSPRAISEEGSRSPVACVTQRGISVILRATVRHEHERCHVPLKRPRSLPPNALHGHPDRPWRKVGLDWSPAGALLGHSNRTGRPPLPRRGYEAGLEATGASRLLPDLRRESLGSCLLTTSISRPQ